MHKSSYRCFLKLPSKGQGNTAELKKQWLNALQQAVNSTNDASSVESDELYSESDYDEEGSASLQPTDELPVIDPEQGTVVKLKTSTVSDKPFKRASSSKKIDSNKNESSPVDSSEKSNEKSNV